MKKLTDFYTLYNGVHIPCIGFGMWKIKEGEAAIQSAKSALKIGYRHLDTAAVYGNERSVGIAIKESGIPREELFITSKLANPEHGYEKTLNAFFNSLEKLQLDYLDLYLIHWPNPIYFRDHWQEANAGTWKAMEELYLTGKIKAIGVSNFRIHHLEELKKTARIAPMVNQIRLCPGDTQEDVIEYCRNHNIILEAYSPLGNGKIFQVEIMKDLAEKYSRSVAQICIRWSLQMGFLPLPKSEHEDRMKENSEVFDFELTHDDILIIKNLVGCCGFSNDPDKATF